MEPTRRTHCRTPKDHRHRAACVHPVQDAPDALVVRRSGQCWRAHAPSRFRLLPRPPCGSARPAHLPQTGSGSLRPAEFPSARPVRAAQPGSGPRRRRPRHPPHPILSGSAALQRRQGLAERSALRAPTAASRRRTVSGAGGPGEQRPPCSPADRRRMHPDYSSASPTTTWDQGLAGRTPSRDSGLREPASGTTHPGRPWRAPALTRGGNARGSAAPPPGRCQDSSPDPTAPPAVPRGPTRSG